MAAVTSITLGRAVLGCDIRFQLVKLKTKSSDKSKKQSNTQITKGKLSDEIVENFIKKMQDKDSPNIKDEKDRVPLSEFKGTTLKTSDSQDKLYVPESVEVIK